MLPSQEIQLRTLAAAAHDEAARAAEAAGLRARADEHRALAARLRRPPGGEPLIDLGGDRRAHTERPAG